jgi:hypothetical protein
VFAEFRRIVRTLETEDKVLVSDRKLVKLYKVIRTRAFLLRAGPTYIPARVSHVHPALPPARVSHVHPAACITATPR